MKLKKNDVEKLDRKPIFKGRILEVVVDDIRFPNGSEAKRELVIHGGAAAVVPMDEEGNIYLVEQYRHAAGGYTLEIPAGCLEAGEEGRLCAEREVEEEIGYKANSLEYLMTILPAVGFSTEKIEIFVAKDLVKTQQNLDEDEYVDVHKVAFDEAVAMIEDGTIKDSKTICALLLMKVRG